MIIDISVGVIALAFVVLVIYLVLTLKDTRKTMKELNRVLKESTFLVDNVNDLTMDIKKKSEALDVIFKPLSAMKKHEHKESSHDKLADLMESLAGGVLLFNKIREGIKSYVKSR